MIAVRTISRYDIDQRSYDFSFLLPGCHREGCDVTSHRHNLGHSVKLPHHVITWRDQPFGHNWLS